VLQLNWGGANGEILINNHGLSRKHIVEGLKSSLKRLEMDYVDIVCNLFLLFSPDFLGREERHVLGGSQDISFLLVLSYK